MRKANFSLLRDSNNPSGRQALVRGSILLFFEEHTNEIRFPLHAFIINLILSIVVSLVLLILLLITIFIAPNTEGFPFKLYCPRLIQGSLLIELAAQLCHVMGSVLLIVGALKRSKILCYTYVVYSTISFIISCGIRIAQLFICEEKKHITKYPPKFRVELPKYYKLILMWLICQIFWYWLVFSFVVAQLEWFKTLRIRTQDDEVTSVTRSTQRQRETTTKEENTVVE